MTNTTEKWYAWALPKNVLLGFARNNTGKHWILVVWVKKKGWECRACWMNALNRYQTRCFRTHQVEPLYRTKHRNLSELFTSTLWSAKGAYSVDSNSSGSIQKLISPNSCMPLIRGFFTSEKPYPKMNQT